MLVHFIPDEKNSDAIIKQFEKFNFEKNRYYIITESIDTNFKYFKNLSNVMFERLSNYNLNTVENKNNSDVIIFHFLHERYEELIKNKFSENKILWMCWGADLYPKINKYRKNLLQQKTKNIDNKISHLRKVIEYFGIDNIVYNYRSHKFKKVLSHINYITTVIPDDYIILKENFKKVPKYIPFNYVGLEERLNNKTDKDFICHHNILVGNSAHSTNNHAEIFYILKTCNIKDKKIIVPLSYGSKSYGLKVEKLGEDLLSDSFYPLMGFLPLDEYNSLISSCDIVIMNHNRQQAGGNIDTAIYLGKKVFLNKGNPFYHFLIREGIKIFSIEDDLTCKNLQNNQILTEKEKLMNKQKIVKIFGKQTVNSNYQKLVRELNN